MNDTPPILEDTSALDETRIRHGFSVGQLNLLVPPGIPAELLEEPKLSPLPLTPTWFKGMTNHRGEAVPVFSLPQLLAAQALPAMARGQAWLLILDKPPKMSGLLINSYPQRLNDLQIIDLKVIDLETVADIPALLKPYITAAYYGNDKNWLDFQHDAWLLSLKTLFQDDQATH